MGSIFDRRGIRGAALLLLLGWSNVALSAVRAQRRSTDFWFHVPEASTPREPSVPRALTRRARRDFRRAFESDAVDRSEVRRAARGWISTVYQSRLRSYDVSKERRADVLRLELSNDLSWRGMHESDGSIVLHKGQYDRARRAFSLRASDPGWNLAVGSVNVLLHEELHGHSTGISRGAYEGQGIALEEAITELLARHATAELLGTRVPEEEASYRRTVNALRGILRDVLPEDGNADARIRRAGVRAWQAPISSASEYVAVFVQGLSPPSEWQRHMLLEYVSSLLSPWR